MKKIILILFGLILNINIFSQIDTPSYIVENGDTIGILISVEQAQKINNSFDLLRLYEELIINYKNLDYGCIGLVKELDDNILLLRFKITELENINEINNSIINDLRKIIELKDSKITNYEKINTNNELIIKQLEKDLKKEKRNKLVAWLTSTALGIINIFLILKG